MIEAAAAAGAGERDALVLETLMAFKRAGATGRAHLSRADRGAADRRMIDELRGRARGAARPACAARARRGRARARSASRRSTMRSAYLDALADAPDQPRRGRRSSRSGSTRNSPKPAAIPTAMLAYVGRVRRPAGLRHHLAALHGLYPGRRPVPFGARRLPRRRVEQIFGLRLGQRRARSGSRMPASRLAGRASSAIPTGSGRHADLGRQHRQSDRDRRRARSARPGRRRRGLSDPLRPSLRRQGAAHRRPRPRAAAADRHRRSLPDARRRARRRRWSRTARDGVRPWLVVASAGTVDTGAIDPLAEIAELVPTLWRLVPCRRRLWRPVRAVRRGPGAARAGSSRPTASRSTRTRPCSCPTAPARSLVRDGSQLLDAFSASADYIRPLGETEVGPSPADLSPELTRHFRALRLWLPLQIAGVAAFRAAQSEKLALARYFHARLSEIDGFDAGPPPDLSVVAFRYRAGRRRRRRVQRTAAAATCSRKAG